MRKIIAALGIATALTLSGMASASASPIKAEDGTYVPGDYYTKERTPYRGYGTCKAQHSERNKRLCKDARDADRLVKMSTSFCQEVSWGRASVCTYDNGLVFTRDGNTHIW